MTPLSAPAACAAALALLPASFQGSTPLPTRGPAEVEFASSIAAALAAAAKEGRLVALVATAEHARGSRELMERGLRDPRVVALAGRTVNVRYDLDRAADACRTWVGEHLLGKSGDSVLAVPQLVFLDAAGKVLSSAAGRLSPGQVEWAFAEALTRAAPARAQPASTPKGQDLDWDRMRPPEQAMDGRVHTVSRRAAPPSRTEIEKLEARLAADENQYAAIARDLAASRSPKVIEKYASVCAWYPKQGWLTMLQHIERKSPPEWAGVVDMALRNPDQEVRQLAARCAEVLGAQESLTMLFKVWKKEKVAAIKDAQLRALVACGPGDRKVVAAVQQALRSRGSSGSRILAVQLLGRLESVKEIGKGLGKALADKDPEVRKAAAGVIAARRCPPLAAQFETAPAKEKDEGVRGSLEEAIEVARKGLRR